MTAPIALCMIVKDEVEHIERCLASVRPYVAEVNIYDTGSTDGTLELLEQLAAQPGAPIRVELGEWRNDFAWARTQSYAMASPEFEWLMFQDGDDELLGGELLADLVSELERRRASAARLLYEITLPRNTHHVRLMRRDSGKWCGAIDEGWRLQDERDDPAFVNPQLIRVAHHDKSHYVTADGSDDGGYGYYMPALMRAADDPVRTPHALYLLAVEAARKGDAPRLIREGRAYFAGPAKAEPGWNHRRLVIAYLVMVLCASNGQIAEAYEMLNAIETYERAWLDGARIGIAPPVPWGKRARWVRELLDRPRSDSPIDSELVLEPPIETELPSHNYRALLDKVIEEVARREPPTPIASPRARRNDPCPCGSGRKFKRCCGSGGERHSLAQPAHAPAGTLTTGSS